MPKVSVIIPVYGVEKYIERCARSLFEQTLDDLEYLFIDDCTPDHSIDILERVLEEYPNRKSQVIIHHMGKNSGQANVREWGIRNATGEYVIHCDSDDWVEKDMYHVMYQRAVFNNSDCVICDFRETDGLKTIKLSKGVLALERSRIINDMMQQKISWSLCNKLFRRELFFNEILYPRDNMGEDMALTLQLLKYVRIIDYISICFYNYFVNLTSIVRDITSNKILENFRAGVNNTNIVIKTCQELYKNNILNIDSIKFHHKNLILHLIGNRKIYSLWYNTYSEINYRIFFERISLYFKLRHLASLCGILPIIFKIQNRKQLK